MLLLKIRQRHTIATAIFKKVALFYYTSENLDTIPYTALYALEDNNLHITCLFVSSSSFLLFLMGLTVFCGDLTVDLLMVVTQVGCGGH